MTPDLLAYSVTLFVSIFITGTLLCLVLYKWRFNQFFHSSLWTKVVYWIPIFLIFLAILYVQMWGAILVTLVIIGFGIGEMLRIYQKSIIAWLYMITISLASAHLILFFNSFDSRQAVNVLLVVGFSSVLSDICAYFFGNFFGRHKLPVWINKNKSWEGVIGQLLGAVIGFMFIAPAIHPMPHMALAILIGIASAIGDMFNSIVKRQVDIKDWGRTIPGHGGVLDRFASLALAMFAAYWWTILTRY